jgi:hypothetical protein
MGIKQEILRYSRQENMQPLSNWFETALDELISQDVYMDVNAVEDTGRKLVSGLISYAKKYAVLKLFEIETGEDEESRYQEAESITDEQAKEIETLISDKNADKNKFCEFFKIRSIADMPAKRFGEATKLLKAKKKVEKAPIIKKAEDDLKALIEKKNKELGVDREPGQDDN